MRRATANRVGLGLVGIVLAAAGAYVLLRRYDLLVPGDPHTAIYPQAAARWVHGHTWVWIVAAAAAVVIGLLALRWLRLQERSQALHRVRPDPDPAGGRTHLPADVLTDAVEEDVADLPGVRRVAASLAGTPDAPRLELRVTIYAGTDVPELRRRILDEAVEPARIALDALALPALLALKVSGRRVSTHVD